MGEGTGTGTGEGAGVGVMYDNTRSGNKVIGDPRDKLHDRLRKILELTRSGNEKEAQAAASRLQSLLTEHNLSMADLERKGAAAPGVREQGHDLGKAAFTWKLNLAEGIAEFYYCVPLIDRRTKTVAFVGRPENVDGLTMLYGWVIDQIKSIATTERRVHYDETREHIDPLRWQINFGVGAVERLIIRLQEMKARNQEDLARNEEGDIVGLALHHASEASDYLEVKYGYRRDGKRTKVDQERHERYQREREEQAELKIRCEEAGDMEPYYQAYSWERPDTPEEIAAYQKRNEAWEKKEAQRAKRRKGGVGGGRSGPAIDWAKEEQADTARSKGRAAAGRINVQPFIGGQTDRKKVG